MNNKKLRVWTPLFFALAMVIGMYFGYRLRDQMPYANNVFRMGNRGQVQEVLDLVRNRYVDPVNLDSINDQVIEGILSQLDPHSIYIPAVQLQEVNEDLSGRFEGIGVEFNIFSDTVHILNVFENGPSDKAGLKAGDRIIKVEDSVVAGTGITSDQIRKLLRGPRGSEVRVTIRRGDSNKQVTIRRGFIPLYSLDASYMLAPETGYIRLNKFAESTYEEFMEALGNLQSKGLRKLILDLRGNGGGILEEAVQIADEFLDGDKLIVYTEGSHSPKREYRCRRPGLFETGKLVLLLNEGSASASEVLAGALQDWDRATIIGRRSFGKGLVQEQYNLSDGSALRLTVARYYTPLGRSIQKPYDKGIEEYNEDILNRYHHGEFSSGDSNRLKIGKAYVTEKGKEVYGGGGITPDIFVALDTSRLDTALLVLYEKNTLGNFVYRYYISHQQVFNQYPDPGSFAVKYSVNDDMISELVKFSSADSVNFHLQSPEEKEILKDRLKSLLARQIWRSEGYYEVVNREDIVIKEALRNLQ